jgi:hypothetical protein
MRFQASALFSVLLFALGQTGTQARAEVPTMEPALFLQHPGIQTDVFYEPWRGSGKSVALSKEFVVLGSPNDGAGKLYVYDALTGKLLREIINPRSDQERGRFGAAVAISGDRLVVGSAQGQAGPAADEGAYVYNIRTGERLLAIRNPFPGRCRQFGEAVAISGETVVVGPCSASGDERLYLFGAASGEARDSLKVPGVFTALAVQGDI